MAFIKSLSRRFLQWKTEIADNKNIIIFSLFLLILSTVIDYNAGKYVNRVGSEVVSDIFIDNIPPIDLGLIFVYGWLTIVLFLFCYPLFFKVKKLHEVISNFSLIIIVRSLFITLTHLKTPLDAVAVNFPGILNPLVFQNDLFFSGHTAIPFLGFLIFKEKKIRYFFLIMSVVMAITVLLMHQHYTIDVLSAYFITYGTFIIGKALFSVINHKKE